MKTSMALILSLFAGVLAVARGETGEYSDQRCQTNSRVHVSAASIQFT